MGYFDTLLYAVAIYPFLFIVGIVDVLLSFIINKKWDDPDLPDPKAMLTHRTNPDDPSSPYRSTLSSELVTLSDPDTNLYSEFEKAVKIYSDMKVQTLGVREIISIDDEKQSNGKVFKKFSLGAYKWTTYDEFGARVLNFSNGLLKSGLKSNDNIVLFADTKPAWLLSAFACFRIKVPIVTLYPTLGTEALAYGINETKSAFVVTSGDQLSKIDKIIDKLPQLTHIIVHTDKFNELAVLKTIKEYKEAGKKVQIITAEEIEKIGLKWDRERTEKLPFTEPKKDDLAIIMYTSGSTGTPKGVMMSHGNLLTALEALISRLGKKVVNQDIYIAYLPLAHVLELCCEVGCLLNGISIGYSSAQTITDNSTAVKKGEKGDLRVLKPTIMAAVPIVLERLKKTVYEKLGQTNEFKQTLFNIAYRQKLRRFRGGRSTRLLDRILFRRIGAAVLGGKVRLMLVGGAILNKEVHEFVQVCLCPVMQAYGLTETCAAATTQLPNQTDSEVIGSIVECCEIRLVDWPEAGYRNTDEPNPRGEIYVGGDNITMGYYNLPDKTAEDYKTINGIRYFATGDVAELLPNGNFKIIDRKKDLVKLQGGEYVSLNKVEGIIKLLPFVDNCCVIANGKSASCIALISPSSKSNEEASEAENKQHLSELTAHCKKHGLETFEIPAKIKLVKEAWLPDTGLVTDSLKLKRKEIEKFYEKDIEKLLKEDGNK